MTRRTTEHGEVCRGMLADANTRAELHRRERNEVRKELALVRQELAHAYDLRDAERKRGDRAEADRDRLDHEVAELKAEAAERRALLARPLIPEAIA